MNLTPSEITGFGSLILGGLVHLKTKKKIIARVLYVFGFFFLVVAFFSSKAKKDENSRVQSASTSGFNSPVINQSGSTSGSNSPVIQSGPNSSVELGDQSKTSVTVEGSPGSFVQTAVNSPNAVQIAINQNANQRWRFLLESDLLILTNKLVAIPKVDMEVACNSGGDADLFADQITYVFRGAGLNIGRRSIMAAGNVFPPGLSILDNRPATDRVEVVELIISAFKSVGIPMNKIEKNNEADRGCDPKWRSGINWM